MSAKDGGPAFPLPCDSNNCPHTHCMGMSLRDWFAGMALQGILSANAAMPVGVTKEQVDSIIAREAYCSADAMIKAREQQS